MDVLSEMLMGSSSHNKTSYIINYGEIEGPERPE
jgi:hypothetical protein